MGSWPCHHLGPSQQQHQMRHSQRMEGKSQPFRDVMSSHLPKGGLWPWERLPVEAGGVTIWESVVQELTGWTKASGPSSLLSLAADSTGCRQTPALTITHQFCPAPWLRARWNQAQVNSASSSHSAHRWGHQQHLHPPPHSGTDG